MKSLHTQRTHRPVSRREQGFSLAELMVVIVIIGLLATMVVPNVIRNLFTAQGGIAKADLTTIKNTLDTYVIENGGRWPDSLDVLITPDENGNVYLGNPDNPQLPVDPWNNPYVYEPPPPGSQSPLLYSTGKDGVPGGEGDSRDIHWNDKEE